LSSFADRTRLDEHATDAIAERDVKVWLHRFCCSLHLTMRTTLAFMLLAQLARSSFIQRDEIFKRQGNLIDVCPVPKTVTVVAFHDDNPEPPCEKTEAAAAGNVAIAALTKKQSQLKGPTLSVNHQRRLFTSLHIAPIRSLVHSPPLPQDSISLVNSSFHAPLPPQSTTTSLPLLLSITFRSL
jgi:hypothetical protein